MNGLVGVFLMIKSIYEHFFSMQFINMINYIFEITENE